MLVPKDLVGQEGENKESKENRENRQMALRIACTERPPGECYNEYTTFFCEMPSLRSFRSRLQLTI